jgi:phosphotransferase system enzyme I (PtsP)
VAFLRKQKKVLPEAIRYGAMLEVPALAECLDMLAPRLSFLSIGTNDLTQFLFAADRAHPKLAERYDWLSPAILRFLARVVRAIAPHGTADGVRRNGRTADGGAGPAGPWHHPPVDHPGGGRADQGTDPAGRSGPDTRGDGRLAGPSSGDIRQALADWASAHGIDCD